MNYEFKYVTKLLKLFNICYYYFEKYYFNKFNLYLNFIKNRINIFYSFCFNLKEND